MQQNVNKEKTNVLELCEAYGGGVKRQVDYINEYVNRDTFDLKFLVSSKRGADIPKEYLVEDRMSDFPSEMFKFFKVISKIRKIIKKDDIDIVHAHSTIAGIIVVLVRLFYKPNISIIYTPHAYFSEVSRGFVLDWVLIVIERIMNHFFDKVIHVSIDEESYALDKKLLSKEKSVVINNGVPKYNMVRKITKKIVFTNVARCSYQKNPELFISVAKTVLENVENCEFIWVGDGPLLDKCRKEVEIFGLENKIKFVGYSSNPYVYLLASNFFFSSSRYEGLPFSVLEAMSVKLPLILTDIVGHRSLISKNGLLLSESDISNDDGNAMLSAFKNVITQQEALSERSYELFLKSYSVEQMIKQIQELYDSLE